VQVQYSVLYLLAVGDPRQGTPPEPHSHDHSNSPHLSRAYRDRLPTKKSEIMTHSKITLTLTFEKRGVRKAGGGQKDVERGQMVS
jgi:hypothetical protein